jgi:hypothetical protein
MYAGRGPISKIARERAGEGLASADRETIWVARYASANGWDISQSHPFRTQLFLTVN